MKKEKSNRSFRNRGWAKITDAVQYAGVGKFTFEKWLKNGLKYVLI